MPLPLEVFVKMIDFLLPVEREQLDSKRLDEATNVLPKELVFHLPHLLKLCLRRVHRICPVLTVLCTLKALPERDIAAADAQPPAPIVELQPLLEVEVLFSNELQGASKKNRLIQECTSDVEAQDSGGLTFWMRLGVGFLH